MKKTDLVFLLAAFLMVFASSAAQAVDTGPPNNCLLIPEVQGSQSSASEYQPDSCVTYAPGSNPELVAEHGGLIHKIVNSIWLGGYFDRQIS